MGSLLSEGMGAKVRAYTLPGRPSRSWYACGSDSCSVVRTDAASLLVVPYVLPRHDPYGRNIGGVVDQVLKKLVSFGKVFPKPDRSTEHGRSGTGVVWVLSALTPGGGLVQRRLRFRLVVEVGNGVSLLSVSYNNRAA